MYLFLQKICHEADFKREDMKWLVKTLDSLLPYTTENDSNLEQKKLESLISRYKNLIPTIEITMIKTEVISKCYTYKREIKEVVTLLNKVREQTMKVPPPDCLDGVNKMVQEQMHAVTQLDNQRIHIMSMIQRGKDLSKDAHAPPFIQTDIKALEVGWNDAYTETVDKLRSLKGIQVIWNKFDDQKHEILSLLGQAETELRSITPLQTDPKNVSSDLQSKRKLNAHIKNSSNDMIRNLHELSDSLKPMLATEKIPLIDREVGEIEKRLFNTMEHINDRVLYLEDYSTKWNNYKDRLLELQNWASYVVPQLIENLQSEEMTPEDRSAKVRSLQNTVYEKMKQLDLLASNASDLAPKDGNIMEAKRLKTEVFKLQESISAINRSVDAQAGVIKEDAQNWQNYKNEVEIIKPWVESCESQLKIVSVKPNSLQEAFELHEKSKLFEDQCESQLGKLKHLTQTSSKMSCKTNAPDEIDAINSRCSAVLSNAKQMTVKSDKLIANWKSLDSDTNKLENWVQNMDEMLINQSILFNSPQIDKLQKGLVQLKSLNNEVSEQQAKLMALTQFLDQISHSIATQAATDMKQRIVKIKEATIRFSEKLRGKINEISDLIMARQDFNSQITGFINWMEEMRGKIDNLDTINVDRVDSGLQDIHSLLQEHSEKKPEFNAIYNDIKNLTLNSTPEDVMILNDAYSTIVMNFQELEKDLQMKKTNLENWNEFLRWKNETNSQIKHIMRQMEKSETYEPLFNEIESLNTNLEHWKDGLPDLDNISVIQLRNPNTGKLVSASQFLNEFETNLNELKFKSQSKKELIQRVEERKQNFNKLNAELGKEMKAIWEKLENDVQLKTDMGNLDDIIKDLEALRDRMLNQQQNKNKIHDEGNILVQQDISCIIPIQECVALQDKNWNIMQQEIDNRLNNYSNLNQAYKIYSTAQNKFNSDLGTVKEVLGNIPPQPKNDKELTKSIDKLKKNVDLIKKLKLGLDDLEKKGNNALKLLNQSDAAAGQKIINDVERSQKDLIEVNQQCGRTLQVFETQSTIWKQIEGAQNEISTWLKDAQNSLSDTIANPIELEYAPIRITKYRSELPSLKDMKQDVVRRIDELKNINGNLSLVGFENKNLLLENEFAEQEKQLDQLEAAVSTLNETEKSLRQSIRAVGDTVGKLREGLLKCDDMSGDPKKVIERLQNCRNVKEHLVVSGNSIKVLNGQVELLKDSHPNFSESIIPKEFNNVQKRYENILLNADKIEQSLSQFLNKIYNDKLGMLKRMIVTHTEKVAWCKPENGSDRYNLEVKKASLNDVEKGIEECEQIKNEINALTTLIEQYEPNEFLNDLITSKNVIIMDLNELNKIYEQTKTDLEGNIELWTQYEDLFEQASAFLKEMEIRIKTESTNPIELFKIGEKMNILKDMKNQTEVNKNSVGKLQGLSKSLLKKNTDIHISQFVSHLTTRYQNVVKTISTVIDRIDGIKNNHETYQKFLLESKNWIKEAKNQQIQLSRLGSPAPTPSGNSLDNYHKFMNEFENGQKLVNQTVEIGEFLYSGIIPENRETIRIELRKLRDDFDETHDEAKLLLKSVETVLMQKTSLEESYGQVKQWLDQLKTKLSSDVKLFPTLAKKKNSLYWYKSQIQDIQLQKKALLQLQDKAILLSDDDVIPKVEAAFKDFDNFNETIKRRILESEDHVTNHESYDKILEKTRDWLTTVKMEALDILNESTFEKDGAEEKLSIVENLILQKDEGDTIIETCQSKLNTVLGQTHLDGHPGLSQSFDEIRAAWTEFLQVCYNAQIKLKQLCNKWNEFDKIIENFHNWMQQRELIVKDQSLKSSLEHKLTHLNKLKVEEKGIDEKSIEITKIVDQGYEIEGEADLNLRVSRLNTRYQTLRKLCKEAVTKYSVYVTDHDKFNKDYEVFVVNLQGLINELNENKEIVGNLNVLQDRHNKIRELIDKRINELTTFEVLLDKGEKLYPQTSPDGREIIRQQLKCMRNLWDNFSDDLNTTTQKLEQCLHQFGEFTQAQEQLTKWLKEVEESMQNHVVLKATLQEKRAQLQNHKLMHQEILAHNVLIDAVCEKAQQLVNETKDVSLNSYLQSIKELFQNIVQKSEDLLNNLENCAESHNNLNLQMMNAKNWINSEMEKLLDCDDTTGEKNDISRRLAALEILKSNELPGKALMDELVDYFAVVSKAIAPQGNDLIQKEIEEIQINFKNYTSEIKTIEEKLKHALQQWLVFEKSMDELTKWCRASENIFRDQQLKSSTEEKEKQLAIYKEQREMILKHEKDIDAFVDIGHNLLGTSGVKRIKALTSQLLSRYQLLQVLSKEVCNHWHGLTENHKNYDEKLNDVISWITPMEANVEAMILDKPQSQNYLQLSNLQIETIDRAQSEDMISTATSMGENILPETSSHGREKIRQDLRNIRDRWEKLDEEIKNIQKKQEANTIQFSNFKELLQQTISWLENVEKNLQEPTNNNTTSAPEIRSKLFKHKAILQEMTSHKRIIENVNEKANFIINSGNPADIQYINAELDDLNARYKTINESCLQSIASLETVLEFYQQFNDLQKNQLDYQKNLWDKLTAYSDYSGNKATIHNRLKSINELFDTLPDVSYRIEALKTHINNAPTSVPTRQKETMTRDVDNLKLDFDKFSSTLSDIKSGLENRLQDWNLYESNVDKLIEWLGDSEISLKNYSLKTTIGEKKEQLNKYQVRFYCFNGSIYCN